MNDTVLSGLTLILPYSIKLDSGVDLILGFRRILHTGLPAVAPYRVPSTVLASTRIGLMPERGRQPLPHSGPRPVHQKSTCHTQPISGLHAVQIRSRFPHDSGGTKPSCSLSQARNRYIEGECAAREELVTAEGIRAKMVLPKPHAPHPNPESGNGNFYKIGSY